MSDDGRKLLEAVAAGVKAQTHATWALLKELRDGRRKTQALHRMRNRFLWECEQCRPGDTVLHSFDEYIHHIYEKHPTIIAELAKVSEAEAEAYSPTCICDACAWMVMPDDRPGDSSDQG